LSDDLSIRITPAGQSSGAQKMDGWLEVSARVGIETCPNSYDISYTSQSPISAADLNVSKGDGAQVYLGGDLIITGYVDKVIETTSGDTHTLRLVGRGKCQDLVDCSAEWPLPGGQITGANALDVATKLAAPYGITVSCLGPLGPVIPQFNLTLTETAYQIIEEVCRFAQLLPYEGADGNLILNQVGTTRAASGFVEGGDSGNIQARTLTQSADQLYSEYDAFLMDMDVLGDTGNGGNQIGRATDPNMLRHRRRAIIAEAPAGRQNIAQARAIWECSRRAGRSRMVNLTTDTWRDAGGTLWTPNTIVPVTLPKSNFGPVDLVIAEVVFRRGASGTTADLTVMPSYAFLPEPILLLPPVRGVNA
jgi:prophage tail gpP-like protein